MKKIAIAMIAVLVLTTAQSSYSQIGDLKKGMKNVLNKKEDKSNTSGEAQKNLGENDQYIDEKYESLMEIIRPLESFLSLQSAKDALPKARVYNYSEVYNTLQEKGKGTVATGTRYDYLLKFKKYANLDGKPKEFDFRSKSLTEAGNAYKDAYALRANNQPAAIDKLKEGKVYADLVLAFFPEHEEGNKIAQKISKSLEQMGVKQAEAIATSDIHKQNIGKILFSNKPVIPGKESPDQFTNTFGPNDKIYAIAYLDGKISDYLHFVVDGRENAEYSIHLNGQQKNIRFAVPQELSDQSYFTIEIIPDPEHAISESSTMAWYQLFAALPPDEHKLKLWLWFKDKQVAEFTEEVTLAWEDGIDLEKLEANARETEKSAENNFARIRQLPDKFKLEEVAFSDPVLSKDNIIKMYKDRVNDIQEVLKVHVVNYTDENGRGDWKIEKNDLDIPTRKVQNGFIGIIYKSTDGWCYYEDYVTIQQTYEGGGQYASPSMITHKKDRKKITCDRDF